MNDQQWNSENTTLDSPEPATVASAPIASMVTKPKRTKMWFWTGAGVFVVLATVGLLVGLKKIVGNKLSQNSTQNVKIQSVDTGNLGGTTSPIQLNGVDKVVVNGQLQTNQGLVVTPTNRPTNAVNGQVYLDQNNTNLYYYNGKQYVTLGATVTNVTNTVINNSSQTLAGVKSLQGATGDIAFANASVAGTTITINNATTTAKGIASFNGTDLQVNGGVVDTIQGISQNSAPTFAGLTLNGNLNVGASNTIFTNIIQQTSSGSNISINAGSDRITLFANGLSFTLPSTGGTGQTICTTGVSCAAGGGQAVILGPNNSGSPAAQGNNSPTIPSIFLNNTGGANLLQLQGNGVNNFVVAQNGDTTINGTASANFFSGNGSLLTNLNGSNITSGTVADARLSVNVTLQGNVFNGANQLVQLTGGGFLPVLNGSLLTNLNGSSISSGTVGDAFLSSNVALLNRNNQIFTGFSTVFKNTSTTAFEVQNAAGSEVLTVDTSGGRVLLGKANGSNGNLVFNTVGGGTITLAPTNGASSFTLTLPGETGTLCSTAAVCSGYAAASPTGQFVQLQAATPGTAQTGSLNVSGTIIGGTNVQTPLLDTASAGALNIGTTNATAVNLNQSTTIANNKSFTANGNTLFKDATNAINGFQIQNANADSLFNVNTSSNIITLNGGLGQNAFLQTWASTSSLSVAVYGEATVTNGAYVYSIGGYSSSNVALTTVQYASINADGTLGSWSTTTALPEERGYAGATITNGYIYLVGGFNNFTNTASQTIYYAKINSDGTLGSWQEADNKLNTGRGGAGVITSGGNMFIVTGSITLTTSGSTKVPDGTVGLNTTEYAKVNPDGSVGGFTTSGVTLTGILRTGAKAVVANGYAYLVGGLSSTNTSVNTVFETPITTLASTTPGTWTGTSSMATARAFTGATVLNGYLYAMGGGTVTSGNSSVELAALNGNGTIGSFTTDTHTLLTNAGNFGNALSVNGYIYLIGGSPAGTPVSTVQYSSGSRILVGSSLDLVGIGSESLANGGSGGTLTSGNTSVVGSLTVSGSSTFRSGIAVNGDLVTSGYSAFRNAVDSLSSFQIQNAAGTSVFIADTLNSTLQAGTTSFQTTVSPGPSVNFTPANGVGTNLPVISGFDGFPVFAFVNSNLQIELYKCNNFTCTSRSSPAILGVSGSVAGGNNNLSLVLSGQYPAVFYATSSGLTTIHCGSPDCSTGNSSPTLTANAPAGDGTPGNEPYSILNGGLPFTASRSSNNVLLVTRCTNTTCDSSGSTVTIINGTSQGGHNSQMALGYCSEADRAAGKNPNTCPMIISQTNNYLNGGLTAVTASSCADAFCGSPSTSFITSANTNNGSYSLSNTANGQSNLAMTILKDGYPFIVRTISSSTLEVIKCGNATCSANNTATYLFSGTVTVAGISVTLGNNSLPLILYQSTGSGTPLTAVQCLTETCSQSTTATPLVTNSGLSGIIIGADGLPFIIAKTNGAVSLWHCIDLGCQVSSSASIPSGGVSLGARANAYAGIYVNTINDGVQTASFQVTHDGVVVANALTSDRVGNVTISSTTTSALKVVNANTLNTVLNVDASSGFVGINIASPTVGLDVRSDTLIKQTSATAFRIQNASGLNILSVNTGTFFLTGFITDNAAQTYIAPNLDNSVVFQIQNAAGNSIFTADTTGTKIIVNQGSFVVSGFGKPATPVLSANSNQGGTLSGAAGTTYYYRVSDIGPGGESVNSSEVSFNGASFTPLTPPGAAVAAPTGIGNLNGTYQYKLTFVTANGETTGGTTFSATTSGSQQMSIAFIPTGPAGTTARKIYRTAAGGADGTQKLVTTINDNTTISYTDNIADGSLGVALPGSNTATTNTNQLNVTFSTITGATSYRIYRGTAPGGENTYQTTAVSPFVDTGSAGTSGIPLAVSTSERLGVGTSTPSANLDIEGNALFKNLADTTTALQVQNAAGVSVFNVDTTNQRVGVGIAAPLSEFHIVNGATQAQSGFRVNQNNLSNNVAEFQSVGTNVLSVSGVNGSAIFQNRLDSTIGFQVQNATGTALFNVDTTNGKIGTPDTTAASTNSNAIILQSGNASGSTSNSGNFTIDVGSATGTVGNISIGTINATSITLGKSGGTLTINSGSIFNGSITVNKHIISGNSSGTTTVAAGAAACTTPTVSLAGNDTAGQATITTGSGCASSGALATITFANSYGAAPRIILTPANANGTTLQYFSGASTTTTFTVNTNTIPVNATTYLYNYYVLQ